jgi:hypothetical protein
MPQLIEQPIEIEAAGQSPKRIEESGRARPPFPSGSSYAMRYALGRYFRRGRNMPTCAW